MGRRDARRLGVIQAALQGKLTNREGADSLQLSLRQFKRLRQAVAERGAAGVVHGNRRRPSGRRLGEDTVERVQGLLTRTETRLNDVHLADLLREQGVTVSAASVRRIRVVLGLAAKRRRRPPQHRRRRQRALRLGALVQIDGSPCAWWQDQGPPWTLIGAIDDATGRILALTFQPSEDVHGYATMLSQLFRAHGLPAKFYGDHTSVLVRNDRYWSLDEELAGRQQPPQMGRVLEELGIAYSAARSPQAKGRIERLWNTLQDRLAAELRLNGLRTPAAAEAFLPGFVKRFNVRFARHAAETASAFRPAPHDLDRLLCCRYQRVVARDNTVSLPGRWCQIPAGPRRRSWHPARVEVRELLDGRLLVLHPRHGLIAQQPAPPGAFRLVSRDAPRRLGDPTMAPKPKPAPSATTRKSADRRPTKPAPDHPLRGSYKQTYRLHSTRPGGDRITDELEGQNH